jgi:succinylarginine dihydrolase
MTAVEANFDGLVGPTHNYGGLSRGNLASAANKNETSNPREAALQGLAKMKRLAELGLVQGILPPQERPFMPAVRALGFTGSDRQAWSDLWRADPLMARNLAAASAMWAANAGTVSASPDCRDARVHVSAANLISMLHRSFEGEATARALARVFGDPAHFEVHAPLPCHAAFADEGAANFMRLAGEHADPGVECFVYGRNASDRSDPGFPARQTQEACAAIARRHGVERAVYVRQARAAIAAGAFHNDVVAVANRHVLFAHEQAFEEPRLVEAQIRTAARGLFEPVFISVPAAQVPLGQAIRSYLFNSQLVDMPGRDRMTLVVPEETRENEASWRWLQALIAGNGPIGYLEVVNVRQSMRNGGGPACLRLRVVLTLAERHAAAQGFFLTDALYEQLTSWVRQHYRDHLSPDDLGDPDLVDETQCALDALCAILPLGSDFYAFQRA